MKKLLEILNLQPTKGMFGIEVETEGANLPVVDSMFWRAEHDGSLRNGMEYVMKKPLDLKKVGPVLKHLVKELNDRDAILKFSFRTSVHFHVNVQDLTPSEIYAMMYTYILLEGPMMTYCGEYRKCNRFCLRFEDAEAMAEELSAMFRAGDNGITRRPNDKMRYAALNIEALSKYGSLEFRAMEGNLDVVRLELWATILKSIRDFAVRMGSPTAVFDQYVSGADPIEFVNEVFGMEIAEKLITKDTVGEIHRSFSISLDLPFEYKAGKEAEILKAARMKEREERIAAARDMEIEFPKIKPAHIGLRDGKWAIIGAGGDRYIPPLRPEQIVWEDLKFDVPAPMPVAVKKPAPRKMVKFKIGD